MFAGQTAKEEKTPVSAADAPVAAPTGRMARYRIAAAAVMASRTSARPGGSWGMIDLPPLLEIKLMADLLRTFYWDKKLKIAVLTILTFAALC
jgi:hypothetical protein